MLELRVLNRQPGLRKNGSCRSRGGAEIWLLPCHLYVTYCPPGEGLCCSSDWIVSPQSHPSLVLRCSVLQSALTEKETETQSLM